MCIPGFTGRLHVHRRLGAGQPPAGLQCQRDGKLRGASLEICYARNQLGNVSNTRMNHPSGNGLSMFLQPMFGDLGMVYTSYLVRFS